MRDGSNVSGPVNALIGVLNGRFQARRVFLLILGVLSEVPAGAMIGWRKHNIRLVNVTCY